VTLPGLQPPSGTGMTTRLVLVLLAVVVTAIATATLTPFPATAQPATDDATVRDFTAGKLDLNRASLEAILALPIPEDVARRIHDHRTYVSYFGDIYDLMLIEGMTAEMLAQLKPLVATLPPPPVDASIRRLTASYRQVRRFLGQEGAAEGLVDEYLDQLRDPQNINEADLFDLMSYQNVSPVDAVRIVDARDQLGSFENQRQLRRSPGLRYWAFRNLRDYVVYSDEEDETYAAGRVTGDYQVRYYDTPYYNGDDDEIRFSLQLRQGLPPAFTQKLRLNLTRGLRAGVLTSRYYAEQDWNDTVKGFLMVQNKYLGAFRLKRAVVGNYRAAFGLGLVMDNTDFTLFRKTGYGWNKRLIGIRADLSRTRQYDLLGGAVEGTIGPLNASFFASSTKKDAILNPDGTVNRLVLMIPRPEQDFLDDRDLGGWDGSLLRREAVDEDLIGGNLKFMLGTGTYLGVTGYEARYDKGFSPDVETLVEQSSLSLLQARDSEIPEAYRSVFLSEDGNEVTTYKFRRVLGAEFQTVFENVALQGEYAFLQDPRNDFFSGKNPDAYIINAYTQWNDLHLLAIYRDYDVGYDNPYNRAFSNDRRYEQTLLDSPFRLNDPLYSFLPTRDPQPKPEQGLFFDARYRINRNLILTGFQYDQWKRKADGADLQRYTIKGEFQPIFNLRFRVRHRFSARTENNPADVRTFRSFETRWQLIAMLSNYNRLAFTYMTANTQFPARPRLSFPVEPGDPDEFDDSLSGVGLAADATKALEVRYEHHLTPWIIFTLASSMYDGFFWNFEGNEFVLLDGIGYRNWFKFESRISHRLLLQLKVTNDHGLPRTYLDIRRFGDAEGNDPDADYVPRNDTFVRVQLDYNF